MLLHRVSMLLFGQVAVQEYERLDGCRFKSERVTTPLTIQQTQPQEILIKANTLLLSVENLEGRKELDKLEELNQTLNRN